MRAAIAAFGISALLLGLGLGGALAGKEGFPQLMLTLIGFVCGWLALLIIHDEEGKT